jgi:hypothetical protein
MHQRFQKYPDVLKYVRSVDLFDRFVGKTGERRMVAYDIDMRPWDWVDNRPPVPPLSPA